MAREWKVGDWAEYRGVRHLVYNVTSDGYGVYLVTESAYGKDGHCSPATNNPDLKHLPDCTGWDWKPPKPIVPPEGYRLLEREEVVLEGDICIERAPLGNVHDWRSAGGKSIGCHAGWRMDNYGVECFARKIQPRYRPFANAAEFAPHRDKWVADEDGDLVRVITLADKKLATSYGSISFKDAFVRYKFEDGSPFGVLES